MYKSQKLQYLDVLKGVIIFFVVVGHAFHFGFAYYRSPLLLMLRSMDMPIFLFISGLLASGVISFTSSDVRAYWLKKGRQLLLPMLGLPIIYALIRSVPMQEIIFGMMHGGYWFTLVLFEMFVLMYGVRYLNHLLNPCGKVVIEIALFVVSLVCVVGIAPHWQSWSPTTYEALSWGKTSMLYHYFILGYMAGRFPSFHKLFVHPIVHAIAGVAFAMLIYIEGMQRFVLWGGVPASLSGLIFAYASAYRIGVYGTFANRAIACLGQESRTIYLTHYLFLVEVPGVRSYLVSLSPGIKLWTIELLISFVYAGLIILVTLFAVRLIKFNPWLATLCYGKRLPRPLATS